ncbi:MAG TPA: hypothetical protein VHU40_15385 [Polyangia bacterium]|nr:hypothetical protein [Polyangia bacterium]
MPHALPATGNLRAPRARHRSVMLMLLVVGLLVGRQAHAADGDDGRTREGWAALLLAYSALGALTVGGAYLMRDNFLGQSAAVGAAGSGGLIVGAAAGAGLGRLRTCTGEDCEMEQAVPALVGGLLGAAAAGVAATLLTRNPGMSRPEVAAVGLTPAVLLLGMGTIFCW